MADENEAWPGAGIPLDFLNLRSDDPKRVEEYFAQMQDAQARRKWLDRFSIESDRAKSLMRRRPGKRPDWQLTLLDNMYERCLEVHTYLTRIAEPETKSQAVEEVEPARGKAELRAAQCCLVVHYLLHAAGHKERDKAVEQLIVALTGYGKDGIRKRLADMFTRKVQTSKDLQIVKLHFEAIGLTKIVELIEKELASREKDDEED